MTPKEYEALEPKDRLLIQVLERIEKHLDRLASVAAGAE